MAELFLARSVGPQGFEKLIVLKKILPQYAASPRFVRLFLDEAKLAAGFEHPNIAHVFDMGTVDGNYFFTMEFVHGQDVRSTLHRGWQDKQIMPIDHAVQVARNVASALHYAHERRRSDGTLLDIVHRDVSPSNIMLSYDGAVKLLDFGVAKASSSTNKTRTGTLKGKISYMSPEQAKGAPVDRRSDIFSLGIVLWEMITGARLFRGENDLATIQMIINQAPPSPVGLRPDCPPELERIVLHALAPDPQNRIATAQQLQVELEELARENKLNQSSVGLGTYIAKLFAPEIKEWREAEKAGLSLGEFVMGGEAPPGDSLTTPVSVSDFSIFEDEIEEPDLDDEDGNPDDIGDATDTASMSDDSMLPKLLGIADKNQFRTERTPAPVTKVSRPSGGSESTRTPPRPVPRAPSSAEPSRAPSGPVRLLDEERATREMDKDEVLGLLSDHEREAASLARQTPLPPQLPATAVVIEESTDFDEGLTMRDSGAPYVPAFVPTPITHTASGPVLVATPQGDIAPQGDMPPAQPSGPISVIVRRDGTPLPAPTQFPVVKRDEWTRAHAAYEPPPAIDDDATIARRRMWVALAVIGCVLIILTIGKLVGGNSTATSGSRGAAPTIDAASVPSVPVIVPPPPTPEVVPVVTPEVVPAIPSDAGVEPEDATPPDAAPPAKPKPEPKRKTVTPKPEKTIPPSTLAPTPKPSPKSSPPK